MARVNIAGFEEGDLTEGGSTGTVAVNATAKHTGGYGLQCNPSNGTASYAEIYTYANNGAQIAASIATSYVGFWFKAASLPASNQRGVIYFRYGATLKLQLLVKSTGVLYTVDAGSTTSSDSSSSLTAGTWYYIQVKCGTAASNAEWEVKVNGTTWLSSTTANTSANNAQTLRVGPYDTTNAACDFYYDDIVWDNAAYPPDYSVIGILMPDGDSATNTDFAASAGNKYECVDETPLNSDTDYINTTTNGAIYTATLQSCAAAGISASSIGCVKQYYVAKDAGGTSSFTMVVRSGTTNYNNGTNANISNSYARYCQLRTTDPATSAAWTTSGLDALELGLSSGATEEIRCTRMALLVEYVAAAAGNPYYYYSQLGDE